MVVCKRKQIDPYLLPCIELKFQWIKDLNINPITQKLIEEKAGGSLECIGTGDYFLNITSVIQTLKWTINK